MSSPLLTCPCGHAWAWPGPGDPPADVRSVCPVCRPVSPAQPADAATDNTKVAPANPSPSAAGREPTDFAVGTDLTPGRVLAGFEIIGELNRGGMGVVLKARQQGLDRIVALKVISPTRLGNPDALRRFKQEVRAAAAVHHPNVVAVYHTDLDGPLPFLAMEFVDGIDLSKLVKQAGPLAPADAVYYLHQAATGLQHVHEAGLVHRDIKPANLMVTPNPLTAGKGRRTNKLPKLKILDMGLARQTADAGDEDGITRDGIFLGTPDYVAPEQAEDSRRADIRADIYSLGASMYFVLTGDVPFPGSTIVQKLRRQMTEPPPSLLAKRPEVGAGLDLLVRRMMARNPDERFQTPGELLDAIDRVRRGGAPETSPFPALPSHPVSGPAPGAGSAVFALLAGRLSAKAHVGPVTGLLVGVDGKTVITGGLDGRIKVWNALKLKEAREFEGDIGAVEQLALAPNGRWLASCATRLTLPEMRVQIWDTATGSEHGRLKGARDNYRCVAVSPDGKRVAAGSADRSVWVWSFEADGPKPLALTGHTGPVTGVAFTRTGDTLLSASADGTVRQWDLSTGKERGSLNASVGPVAGLAFQGKRLAAAGRVLAVRQRDGSFLRFVGHDGPVLCAAFSPDGRLLASGGSDATVRLWLADDGTELTTLTGHTGPVRSISFGADAGVLYTGGEDGSLRRWPVEAPLG